MARDHDEDHTFRSVYRAWLPPDTDRRSFFVDGLIVPDANVLLTLYELTADSREAIFKALEQVADRLWLPHQVGLEVVRARCDVVKSQREAFRQTKTAVNNEIQAAQAALRRASDTVAALLVKHSGDELAAREIRLMTPMITNFQDVIDWRELLDGTIQSARDEYDLDERSLNAVDAVLDRIVQLYGDRIGKPFLADELLRLERVAIDFRIPNKLPPAFEDRGKASGLLAAGDFLIWEQILRQVEALAPGQLITFVTKDVKADWWELDQAHRPRHARRELVDEMWHRSDGNLRMETLSQFLEGVTTHLDIAMDDSAMAEVRRVTSADA